LKGTCHPTEFFNIHEPTIARCLGHWLSLAQNSFAAWRPTGARSQ
jgi:hypothetical protein